MKVYTLNQSWQQVTASGVAGMVQNTSGAAIRIAYGAATPSIGINDAFRAKPNWTGTTMGGDGIWAAVASGEANIVAHTEGDADP